jgi:phasin family protein
MADTAEAVNVKKPAQAAASVQNTIESAAQATIQAQAERVQATQATAERAQAAGAQAFREGVDRSVASLTELNAAGKKNLEAWVESTSAAQRGVEALSQQSMGYAKKSWEDGVNAAQTLAQARSVQELVELQTSFAKTAIETYLSEVTKMTDTFTASMKDSFRPLNERVTASVERFQAAR